MAIDLLENFQDQLSQYDITFYVTIFEYDMVLIDLLYVLKLSSRQFFLFRRLLLNSLQRYLKRKFCSVNVKCGAAKIYGLRFGFSNSN